MQSGSVVEKNYFFRLFRLREISYPNPLKLLSKNNYFDRHDFLLVLPV